MHPKIDGFSEGCEENLFFFGMEGRIGDCV
jgi:hypothetical protein